MVRANFSHLALAGTVLLLAACAQERKPAILEQVEAAPTAAQGAIVATEYTDRLGIRMTKFTGVNLTGQEMKASLLNLRDAYLTLALAIQRFNKTDTISAREVERLSKAILHYNGRQPKAEFVIPVDVDKQSAAVRAAGNQLMAATWRYNQEVGVNRWKHYKIPGETRTASFQWSTFKGVLSITAAPGGSGRSGGGKGAPQDDVDRLAQALSHAKVASQKLVAASSPSTPAGAYFQAQEKVTESYREVGEALKATQGRSLNAAQKQRVFAAWDDFRAGVLLLEKNQNLMVKQNQRLSGDPAVAEYLERRKAAMLYLREKRGGSVVPPLF